MFFLKVVFVFPVASSSVFTFPTRGEFIYMQSRQNGLIPKVHKLDGHGKILRADGGDDGLQLIPALAGHADGVALDLCGHLEFAVADEASDLPGDGCFNALFDFDDLSRVAERGNVRPGCFHALEADVALGEPAHDDFRERVDFELVPGGELDFVFFENNFPCAALEVEAVGQFLVGLIDGVFDFHRVDLGNNVE